MSPLDNRKKINEIDKSSIFESVSLLPEQIQQAWNETIKINFPFQKIKNIVVAGMGGSALGAGIIDSLNFEVLDLPMEIVKAYHLPAYVNSNTLTIISSYSGNTEETLSCFNEALERKSQVFIITSGGKLADLAKKKRVPAYIFSDRFNPSRQPRLGLGYSVAAQLAVLSKLKLINLKEAQITEAINYLMEIRSQISIKSPLDNNIAKQAAFSLKDKIIIVVSSEHLIGVAHAFKNMINENSKTFAVRFSIPEVNHHLLEGLLFPKENKKILKVIFIESEIYDEIIKRRFKITKNVVEKNKIPSHSLSINGRTRVAQTLETLFLGNFISYYLAILNEVDPALIPWVEYFKKTLKKMS